MSPEDLFQRVHPTRLLLWGLVLVFLHQTVVGILHTWNVPLLLNITAATAFVLVALPLLHLRAQQAAWTSTLRLHALQAQQIPWLVLLAVAVLPPAHVIGLWNHQLIPPPPELEEFWAELVPGGAASWVATFLTVAVVVPIGEEIVFRGIVQQAARRALGPRAAVVGTAALFAVVHFEPWYLFGLLMIGLALGAAYERTGSLLAPIVVHSLYNTGALVAAWWARRLPEEAPDGVAWPLTLLAVGGATLAWTSLMRLQPVRAWEESEVES